MSIVKIDTVETAWNESNKHLHAKIAELADLADYLDNDVNASLLKHHIPVYASKELMKFVEKRYASTHFSFRNCTFYFLPFGSKEIDNFQECLLDTDTFGWLLVKYTTSETEHTSGGENCERVTTSKYVSQILSIEHVNGQELLPFLTQSYIKEIEDRINMEVLC